MPAYQASSQSIINTTLNEEQESSLTILLSGGRYAVIWETDEISSGRTLHAQIFNKNGSASGGELDIGDVVDNHQSFYSAAALPDGGFALVWGHYDGTQGSSDAIMIQRYDAIGAPVGGTSQVNTNSFLYNTAPDITVLADGGYVVIWHIGEGDGDPQPDSMHARIYNADGTPRTDEFLVNPFEDTNQNGYSDQRIMTFADGSFGIAWQKLPETVETGFDTKIIGDVDLSSASVLTTLPGIDHADQFTIITTDSAGNQISEIFSIYNVTTIYDLASQITNRFLSGHNREITAVVTFDGRFSIESKDGQAFRIEDSFVGSGKELTKAGFDALGFSDYFQVESTSNGGVAATRAAATVTSSKALTSISLYESSGNLLDAGDFIAGNTIYDENGNVVISGLGFFDTINLDVYTDDNSYVVSTVLSFTTTFQDMIDLFNLNTHVQPLVHLSFKEETGQLVFEKLSDSVNAVGFRVGAVNAANFNLGLGDLTGNLDSVMTVAGQSEERIFVFGENDAPSDALSGIFLRHYNADGTPVFDPDAVVMVGDVDVSGIFDLTILAGIATGDQIAIKTTDELGDLISEVITISTGETAFSLAAKITNQFLDNHNGEIFAKVTDEGFLSIENVNKDSFRVSSKSGASQIELSGYEALGLGDYFQVETNGAISLVGATIVARKPLVSVPLYEGVGDVLDINDSLFSPVYDAAGNIVISGFGASDQIIFDVYTSGGTISAAFTFLSGSTIQSLLDAINLNGSVNSLVHASFDETTGQLRFESLAGNVNSLGIRVSTSFSGKFDIALGDPTGNLDDFTSQGAGLYERIFSFGAKTDGVTFIADNKGIDFNAHPAIQPLHDGGYVVSWRRSDFDSPEDGVFFKIYNHDGSERTSDIHIAGQSASGGSSPKIGILPDDSFVIVWYDYKDGDGDIFAQIFTPDGSPQGVSFMVNENNAVTDFAPNIEVLEDGKFIITWSEYNINVATSDFFSPTETANIISKTFTRDNFAPVLGKDKAYVDEDSSVVIDVLKNDQDADGDDLTIIRTWDVKHGEAVINADGTITYTPDADYFGEESFYYQVTDGFGGYTTQRVNVTINPVDDGVDANVAPDAVKDKFTVYTGQTVDLYVLANDSDANGDTLTVDRIWKLPENNNISVSLNGDNTVEFSVSENFSTSASYFMYYQISDGNGGVDVSSFEVKLVNPDVNLFGSTGLDEFLLDGVLPANGTYNITDFNVSDGDFLNIDNIISGYDPLSDAITDFVRITDNGTDSTVAVDADGGADSFVDIAILYNVTGLTDEDALEGGGSLLVS